MWRDDVINGEQITCASHSLLWHWGEVYGGVWNQCMSPLMLHLYWDSVWPRGSLPSVSLYRRMVKKGFYLRWEYLELTIDLCHRMNWCFCAMKYQERDRSLVLGARRNNKNSLHSKCYLAAGYSFLIYQVSPWNNPFHTSVVCHED